MYNTVPVGRIQVRVCTTTPCWLCGSDDVVRACKDTLGVGIGESTPDGQFFLREFECLGACANAPILWIDDDFYEDIDYAGTKAVLEALMRGERPTPGPQNGRKNARCRSAARPRSWTRVTEHHAARSRPDLHQSLRRAALGPRSRATPWRLGRHQGLRAQGARLAGAADQGQRPARARRGRLRHRPEMVVHAQAADRPALSRGQRRRIRARHLQGPGDHAPRPAQAGRGLPDRRGRHGLHGRLHLHPRRVHPRGRGRWRPRSRRPTTPA